MEHTQAQEMNAPDRYVLGQLSAAEADAFEEHYFDCTACAEDVRLGMSIMEGGRLLVQQDAEEPAPVVHEAPVVPINSRPRWSKWIPAAAVAAVMAIPVHFALLVRMQNMAPRVVQVAAAPNPADALMTGDALDVPFGALVRGPQDPGAPEAPLVITRDSGVINVPHDESDPPHTTYKFQILDAAEKVVAEQSYPRETVEAKPYTINARVLKNGEYRLLISGIGPAGRTTRILDAAFSVKRPVKGAYQQRGPRRERWNSPTTPVPVLQAA